MKQIIKYFILLAFISVVFVACDKDDETCCDPTNPECPNYDPCFGKMETTAYFTIAQQFGPIGENASLFITDDVVLGGTIKFSAIPQDGATYTWILGIDTVVGGPEVTTDLGGLPVGTYPNTLIVTKIMDTLCFPNDPGVAQFTRSFTRISGCDAQITGKFRGIFEGAGPDSVVIELALSPSVNEILPCTTNNQMRFFVNANTLGDTSKTSSDGASNRLLSLRAYGALDEPEGMVEVDTNGIVTANYMLWNSAYSFKGRKL